MGKAEKAKKGKSVYSEAENYKKLRIVPFLFLLAGLMITLLAGGALIYFAVTRALIVAEAPPTFQFDLSDVDALTAEIVAIGSLVLMVIPAFLGIIVFFTSLRNLIVVLKNKFTPFEYYKVEYIGNGSIILMLNIFYFLPLAFFYTPFLYICLLLALPFILIVIGATIHKSRIRRYEKRMIAAA